MGTPHKSALTTLKQLNPHYAIPLYNNHHLEMNQREKPLGYQRILGNLQRLWQPSSSQQVFLRSTQICFIRNSCTVWELAQSTKASLSFNSTLFSQDIFPKECLELHRAVTWSSIGIKKLSASYEKIVNQSFSENILGTVFKSLNLSSPQAHEI